MSLTDNLKARMDAVFDLGEKLEAQLDSAKEEGQRYSGAENGLDQAIRGLDDLQKHVEKDLEEGAMEKALAEFEGEPMKLAAFVKSWLLKARGCVNNLHVGAKVNTLMARGKIEALETSVKHAKGMFDACNAKMEAIRSGAFLPEEAPPAAPDGPGATVTPIRQPGQHPGDPLAARRAESAVKKPAAKGKKNGKASKKPEESAENDGPHAG